MNGVTWAISTIRQIWNQLYLIWKARCDYHHGSDNQSQREQSLLCLQPLAEQLYATSSQLDLQDRRIINKPLEDLLKLPTSNIENWIYKAKPIIKASLLRARIKASKSHLPIHHLFNKPSNIPVQPSITTKIQIPKSAKKTPEVETLTVKTKRLTSRLLTSFFTRSTPYNTREPFVETPPSDDKPP
jgi:hypothetical protein